MRINNNVMAMNAHRQLGINTAGMARSMERLSSGMRINRAADDPAGLAISEKMRGQIRGLRMAARNAQDTISMIQTAEGALNETHAILQRIRELAVQAANDTNTDLDRREIQAEVAELIKELDRIGNTTEFNTKKLLDGSASGVSDAVPASAKFNGNSAVEVNKDLLNEFFKSIRDDTGFDMDGAYILTRVNESSSNDIDIENEFKLIGPNGEEHSFIKDDETGQYAAHTVNGKVILNADTRAVTFAGHTLEADFSGMGVGLSSTFAFSAYRPASNDLANSFMTQIGANSGQVMFVSIGDMRAKALGVAGIDLSTRNGAMTAMTTVDNAIQRVSHQRASLGAAQNRLESAIRSLDNMAENLQAAESRIRDADMAKEMMEYTRFSILQQVSQAMLAQANQMPKRILQLLQ